MADLHGRGEATDIRQWLQVEGGEDVAWFAESYGQLRDAAAATEPEVGAADDDMLYIMYTSGTTGLPKGVVHTHNTSIWAILTIAVNCHYREDDRFLGALPMFHVGALTPCAVNVYQGATSVVMRGFAPQLAWELLERERVTIALMVPAMLNFMLQVPGFERFDFSRLRWIMTGAAPVPVALTQRYMELGVGVRQVYGLTESCGPACLMDAEDSLRKPDSTGKSFFHTDVRVVNGAGEDCAPGEPGEVLVAGPHIMREYWNRPEATAETIVDGWLHTGDVATMDEEGFVSIQDRIKDMIISGGENVYPAEIEGVLMTHADIADAAVIGQESEAWGESPLAVVVRSSDAGSAKRMCSTTARGGSPASSSPRAWYSRMRFRAIPAARSSSSCCANGIQGRRRCNGVRVSAGRTPGPGIAAWDRCSWTRIPWSGCTGMQWANPCLRSTGFGRSRPTSSPSSPASTWACTGAANVWTPPGK